jgi:hypothetical protein
MLDIIIGVIGLAVFGVLLSGAWLLLQDAQKRYEERNK